MYNIAERVLTVDIYNILWDVIKRLVAVKTIANPQHRSASFYGADVMKVSPSCDKLRDGPTIIAWFQSFSERNGESCVYKLGVLSRLLPASVNFYETQLFFPRSLLPQEYRICLAVSLSSWNLQRSFKYLGCFQVPAVSSWKGLFQARPTETRWTVHTWMVLSTWIHVKQTRVSWKSLWYDGDWSSVMIIIEVVVLQSHLKNLPISGCYKWSRNSEFSNIKEYL